LSALKLLRQIEIKKGAFMVVKTKGKSQELLHENEVLIQNLRDHAPYPLLVLNPDTSIKYANWALEDLTGYSSSEIIGCKPPFPWFTGDIKSQTDELLRANMLKGEQRSEKLARKKNGELFWIQVSSKPIMIRGELRYFLSNWVDITERKKAEAQLSRLNQELRNLTAHLDSIREEERANISRMIHDELGQALIALKMDVFWLGKNLRTDQKNLAEVTKSMLGLIDDTFDKARWISTVLRPRWLDDLGLCDTLKWLAEEFQEMTEINTRIVIGKDVSLDKQLSTAIYRIFQEALTNIFRHSKASRVQISLRQNKDQVILRVSDNGVGISRKQISNARSFGIMGMRERAQFLGGTFEILGGKKNGTSIRVVLPRRAEEATKC
jgi:two-component system, NarL family, sensor histidine kinase UhpB